MHCDQVRVALSARLDGEDPQASGAALDRHVGQCQGCRAWLARAERLNRAVRIGVAEVPDLTARVLAAVAVDERSRLVGVTGQLATARSRRQILRIAVAVAAVAQLGVALPILLAGFGVGADPHISREMASFDVALAIGFGLAAYRPERAQAFVPVAFVLAACLAATSAVDIANSTTALVHEFGHLAAVAQAGLLWALGRASRDTDAPRTGGVLLAGHG